MVFGDGGRASVMSEPVRLRGHHLVCLQHFRGEGYSPAFVSELNVIIERSQHDCALVVDGADDVCRACPHLAADGACQSPDSGGETEIARIDTLALAVLQVDVGDCLDLAQAGRRLRMNPAAARTWRDEACRECSWEAVCAPSWDHLLGLAGSCTP